VSCEPRIVAVAITMAERALLVRLLHALDDDEAELTSDLLEMLERALDRGALRELRQVEA
jgi:hypothetical protein